MAGLRNALPLPAPGSYRPYLGSRDCFRDYGVPPAPRVSDFTEVYRTSWLDKNAESVSETIRTALDKQEQLEAASRTLRKLITGPITEGATGEELTQALAKLEDSSSAIRDLLGSVARPSFFNERHTTSGLANRVQEVFELPELLEIILSFLDLKDVLAVQQVSMTCFNSIQHSPRLQRKLGLAPDANSFLRVPLHTTEASPFDGWQHGSTSLPGFSYGVSVVDRGRYSFPIRNLNVGSAIGEEQAVEDAATIHLRFATNKISGKLPIIGERYKAMAVCQPPVEEMHAYAECCEYDASQFMPMPNVLGSLPERRTSNVLTAERGLTIGQLYEVAEDMAGRHRLCPDAPTHLLDKDGYVRVTIKFEGKVKLRHDDPVLAHRTMGLQEEGWYQQPSSKIPGLSRRLQAYTFAKQTARDNNEEIPTLAQWEATQQLAGEGTAETPFVIL